MEFWGQKTFCLITGASRGIGKTIAIEFGKKVGPGSVLVLLARSAHALEETKAEILATSTDVKIVTSALDLGKTGTEDYYKIIISALITTSTKAEEFTSAILVHNAGSLGNIQLHAIEMDNLAELQEYYEFNLFSPIILTSQFFKIFSNSENERTVVQISSLGAVQPFKTWSCYCAGKAARDMFLRSIAEEDSSISTLNYAPGPVDTDIYTEAMNKTGNTDLAKYFQDAKAQGSILTAIQTITKLVKILGQRKYRKGEHVDYYDIED